MLLGLGFRVSVWESGNGIPEPTYLVFTKGPLWRTAAIFGKGVQVFREYRVPKTFVVSFNPRPFLFRVKGFIEDPVLLGLRGFGRQGTTFGVMKLSKLSPG